ncbi:MAG TPA: DUF167 domain-containing protein [Polyangiaceae bacterium]|nr:DUF167 domain-containing protein [Polyangiaceae bacterium]
MRVRVKVKASRSRIVGVSDQALVVAVAAPPVEGEANAELVRILARQLGLPRSAVTIVGGATHRSKRIRITGCGRDRIVEKLAG